MEDVAAVLADLGLQSGSLATARALLVAARHPEEAPDEDDDYHHKHDDDGDSHPNLASVRFIPAMGTDDSGANRRLAWFSRARQDSNL